MSSSHTDMNPYGVNKAPSEYAFPCAVPPGCSDGQTSPFGLTKREYTAIKIMAGFAADPSLANHVEKNIPNFAKHAVMWADALLAALSDETKVQP